MRNPIKSTSSRDEVDSVQRRKSIWDTTIMAHATGIAGATEAVTTEDSAAALTKGLDRCIKRSAPSARKNAKCLSSHRATARCTAETASNAKHPRSAMKSPSRETPSEKIRNRVKSFDKTPSLHDFDDQHPCRPRSGNTLWHHHRQGSC